MSARKILWGVLLGLYGAFPGLPAWASRTEDYQPYQGAEQVSAPLLVVIAYSAIWLVLLGFVASVWRRQRQVQADLAQLERQLLPPQDTRHGEVAR